MLLSAVNTNTDRDSVTWPLWWTSSTWRRCQLGGIGWSAACTAVIHNYRDNRLCSTAMVHCIQIIMNWEWSNNISLSHSYVLQRGYHWGKFHLSVWKICYKIYTELILFHPKVLKNSKLMLSNAFFLFKTISSCKKNFHQLFYPTTQSTASSKLSAGGSAQFTKEQGAMGLTSTLFLQEYRKSFLLNSSECRVTW